MHILLGAFVASNAESLFGGWVIPVVILLAGVILVLAMRVAASRYRKVAPGRVGVFFGRDFTWPDKSKHGYLLLTGGGRVQRPVIESFIEVPVEAFQISITEKEVPNQDNVMINVEGVATCKVSTDPANLDKAVSGLLTKLTSGGRGEQTIEAFVQNILTGHLRSIVGKMNIEALIRDREGFNTNLVKESKAELANLGIDLINLAIKDIKDKEGYIEALGKKAVAKAKADAEIEVSNANKQQKTVQAQNEVSIAEAEKDRDVKKAQFLAMASTEQAKANMAGQIETAGQEQTLKVAQAQRDAAEKEAQIVVQTKEGERMKAQLAATIVATAAANKEQTILNAEAEQRVKVITAEADRDAAQAKKAAQIAAGEGEAAQKQAVLVAEAKGKAAETEELLTAQARGTKELADAYARMNEAGRMIIVLDRLPVLFEKGGDAGAKMLEAVFKSVAAPLGAIDNVNIVDLGGGSGVGGMNKLSSVVPSTVFNLLATAKAQGIDLTKLAGFLGIDVSKALTMLGMGDKTDTPAATTAAAPSPEPPAAPTTNA